MLSRLGTIDKRNESTKFGEGSSFLQSFKTMNKSNTGKTKPTQNTTSGIFSKTNIQKNKNSGFLSVKTIRGDNSNNNNDHSGMTKFFQKIKNNLERTLSSKNDGSPDLSKRSAQKPKDNESSSDNEENENKENGSTEANKNLKKNRGSRGSILEQNFRKQQNLFGNKIFKFGGKKNSLGFYENHMKGS